MLELISRGALALPGMEVKGTGAGCVLLSVPS